MAKKKTAKAKEVAKELKSNTRQIKNVSTDLKGGQSKAKIIRV